EITERLGLEGTGIEVRPDSWLVDDLGVDSLQAAELAILLDERGIYIPDDFMARPRTVADLYAIVTGQSRAMPQGLRSQAPRA
ncbi:MAG: hypothetical protein KC466_13680, partial [Myxococcales bacterium]|nr:hypothetical protein [Myxococcales bacterium]